jgi:hypothetical protein
MDYIGLIGFGLLMVLILVVIGLSLTSASLNYYDEGEDYYGHNNKNYYRNPLFKYNSKYFFYRPKGSVILTKNKWAEIEKNIGVKLGEAKEYGRKAGYRQAIRDIQDSLAEKKGNPSPYKVFSADSNTPLSEIERRYITFRGMYKPDNFKHLDPSFVELAEIRCRELDNAWRKISYGIGRSK